MLYIFIACIYGWFLNPSGVTEHSREVRNANAYFYWFCSWHHQKGWRSFIFSFIQHVLAKDNVKGTVQGPREKWTPKSQLPWELLLNFSTQKERVQWIMHLFLFLEKLQPIFFRKIQHNWYIPIFLGELGLNWQLAHFVLKFNKLLENLIPYNLLNMSFAIYIWWP